MEKGVQSLDDGNTVKIKMNNCNVSEMRCHKDRGGLSKCKPVRPLTKLGKSWISSSKGKLMDELLSEINNLRPVRRDSKSFTHFATTIACYVNDMEDNGCPVLESSEAPFLVSQHLSKLDPKDNSDFGREMKREGNEETVSNLISWLHQEASIRSRGKTSPVSEGRIEGRRDKGPKKTEDNAISSEETDEENCPLNCKTKHPLAACPKFQNLTVSQK